MNNFCTFYIVRHATSEANKLGIRAGQVDFDISEEGKEQALARAKELSPIHFAAVFSSDLQRARKTAEIIALEHKLAVTATKILRERNFGDKIQGKTKDETQELLVEYEAVVDFQARKSMRPVEDMETDEEVVERVLTYLREIALAYPGRNVLVVGHRNMMMQILFHLGFATISDLPRSHVNPTSYYVLKSDGTDFEVVKTVGIEKKAA